MKKNLIFVYPPKLESLRPSPVISLALLYLTALARDAGICDHTSIFDFNAPAGPQWRVSS